MNRMLSIAMLALLLSPAVFAQDVAAKRDAAQQSARSWLVFVDRGDYGSSWQETASFFQSKISKADWEKALQQVRAPLGAVADRTLLGALYQTDLPDAPKGEYVIIQYKVEFAGGGPFIETITPMLDKDRKWRVSGYFIKPAQ
jgi:opacity protein-like surface antigen